ncbi:STAS domain-containing protein [Streptomyces sp. NPDC050388]|uniref:STAS domain-containing protein n=1 Tax=Streptomyces sp. NPDC050388 TaxID=3155781 RepID=UPI003421BD45
MNYAPVPGLPLVDAKTPPVLVLRGPVTRDGVSGPSEVLRALLDDGGGAGGGGPDDGIVVCDVGGLGPPGLAAVNLLARLQLLARRTGGRIRLRDPDPALCSLLDLVGLRFEVEGQPEQREPARGVEEAVEPGDPAL